MRPTDRCRRHRRTTRAATHQQQQQQSAAPQRLQLGPEARAAVYSLRRVNVGEALKRLEQPALANEPLFGGTTLLHVLAEQRDAAAVAALVPAALAAGADPNRPDSQVGGRREGRASGVGCCCCCSCCLWMHGSHLRVSPPHAAARCPVQGCGPLFYAANNREPGAAEAGLRLLLAAGADPQACSYGWLAWRAGRQGHGKQQPWQHISSHKPFLLHTPVRRHGPTAA